MAKKTISPLEQHAEKIVLGVAAALMLCGAVYFLVLGMPYSVANRRGESVGASKLGQDLDQAARQLAGRFASLPGPTPPDPKGPVVVLDNPFDLTRYAELKRFSAAQSFPPPLVEGSTSTQRKARPLVAVVPPMRPLVRASRNVLLLPPESPLADVATSGVPEGEEVPYGKDQNGVSWVMVASVIDLEQQVAAFKAAEYPTDLFDLSVFDVEVQRRGVDRTTAGDAFGPWERVETWTPYTKPTLPQLTFAPDGSLSPADRAELGDLWTLLRAGRRVITRPDPLKVEAGKVVEPLIPYLRTEPEGFFDPNKPPEQPNPAMQTEAGVWARRAREIITKTPKDVADAYLYAEAAYWALGLTKTNRDGYEKLLDQLDGMIKAANQKPPKRAELRRRLPLLAYDLTVQPGRTYQWRMRLRILNRFCGLPNNLARIEDAQKILIEGAWSVPTRVEDGEVPSDLYMFLVRAARAPQGKPEEVTVEVFRPGRGATKPPSHRYTVKVGDSIGKVETKNREKLSFATGAVVVDIDSNYLYRPPGGKGPGEPTTALIYTDARNPGVLHEMILARDVIDRKYKELTTDRK